MPAINRRNSLLMIAAVATALGLQALSGCAREPSENVPDIDIPNVPVNQSGTPVIQNITTEFGMMVVVAFPNGDYQTWFIRNQDGRVTSLGHQTSIEAIRSRQYIDHNSDVHVQNGSSGTFSTDEITVAPPAPTGSQ